MNKNLLLLNPFEEKEANAKIDLLKTRKSAWILRAINHKLRQQILKFIAEQKAINVTEIYRHLRLEQSITSQHLAVLRKAGFVKTKKVGKYIHYSINTDRVQQLNSSIDQLLG